MTVPILAVADLRTEFRIGGHWRAAVDGISLTLEARETLALVGESGCGKSMTALSIIGLVPKPAGRIGGGSIRLAGTELVGMPEGQLERVRGDRVAMIFQDPMTSLNPVMTIGAQVAEGLRIHAGCPGKRPRRRRWRCWRKSRSRRRRRASTTIRISSAAACASG